MELCAGMRGEVGVCQVIVCCLWTILLSSSAVLQSEVVFCVVQHKWSSTLLCAVYWSLLSALASLFFCIACCWLCLWTLYMFPGENEPFNCRETVVNCVCYAYRVCLKFLILCVSRIKLRLELHMHWLISSYPWMVDKNLKHKCVWSLYIIDLKSCSYMCIRYSVYNSHILLGFPFHVFFMLKCF
jgi:hypothetical protein